MKANKNPDEYMGKTVRIVTTDGESLIGVMVDHVSAFDNDPDPESIVIDSPKTGRLIEILMPDVLSMEVV